AEVWLAVRAGEADERTFGVHPGSPFAGTSFVFDYVIRDVAHRNGDELLLWDVWGAMRGEAPVDEAEALWMDELARLVVTADASDAAAAEELARRYARDDRLNPRGRVLQASPYGLPDVEVDLVASAPG